ncbi:alpha-ribazole-5-phosphate synthase [Clostridium botulinum]|uniref:AIR synthase related protein n=1 Tax=Clostridium botulinum TaxID=1491 RepID=UPI0007E17DC0|nr:AIR synthase related protein [Clostridium botulinum]KEJ01959.1 alpha-ribazole-5-phosphate synthase CblS for cobalamin biosynthesis [Clostridium botulinum F 357]MBE1304936.1 alpha-ribazole-5-phosphate synthase [Clostridium botulinum]
MNVKKVRDLTLISLDKDKTLVVACDSSGSIGPKKNDILKIPAFYTGKFTIRVGILEVMCTGAEIVTVTNAVCCEMNPTGREIIDGIKGELKRAGIDEVVLTGSTEENFPSFSTGLGITVLGIVDNSIIKVNNVNNCSGNNEKHNKYDILLISVGIPKVGEEINIYNDKEIVDYEDIKILLENPKVYEIVPVGSKGILYEGEVLAKNNNLKLKLKENISIDIKKSNGPATTIIAAIHKEEYENIRAKINNVNIIGKLER